MNCQLFHSIVRELANDGSSELCEREEALAHAGSCAPCLKRLQAEKTLMSGLRNLADDFANERASPLVETRLLASFRTLHLENKFNQAESETKRFAFADSNFASSSRTRLFKRQLFSRVAIAASVVVFTTLIAAYLVLSQKGTPVEEKLLSMTSNVAMEFDWKKVSELAQQRRNEINKREISSPTTHTAYVIKKEKRRRFMPSEENKNQLGEIATNFISLMPDNDTALPKNGQVYRVKLSRSTLISFGLPINMERAGEQITADVVVSEDGVASAIRFVQDN